MTNPQERFRFAVVGAGVIGNHHGKVISALSDQIDLVAVVDHQAERAERLAAERGGKAFATLTGALAAADVDVVVVCTPTGAHGEWPRGAGAGKHVSSRNRRGQLEKTIGIEAQRARRNVVASSQNRFDPRPKTTGRERNGEWAGSPRNRLHRRCAAEYSTRGQERTGA